MATQGDVEDLRKAMKETKAEPNKVSYLGAVRVGYIPEMKCWTATFDCDLTVFFNDADYSSNYIGLWRSGK